MSEIFFTPVVHPPLGTTTQLSLPDDNTIAFTALMIVNTTSNRLTTSSSVTTTTTQSPTIDPSHRFTVLLWWSIKGVDKWQPATFTEVLGAQKKSMLISLSPKNVDDLTLRQDLFTLRLTLNAPHQQQLPLLVFCLKYRFHTGPWLWAGSRIGGTDGRLVFYQPSLRHESLAPHKCFTDAFEKWNITTTSEDENGDIRLYHLTTAAGEDEKSLGRPMGLERYLALVKIAAPWIGPMHGGRYFEVDKSAVMVLMLRQDGVAMLVIPTPGSAGRTPYVVSFEGEMVVKRSGGVNVEEEMGVVVVVGRDYDTVMDFGMNYLRGITTKVHAEDEYDVKRLRDREDWERGLSYCTWNGLGADLSEDKILHALGTLLENGIKVTNLIIDDNWQTLSNRKYNSSGTWSSFEANENFPSGLQGLTTKIRERYPFIKHIGVWHALLGYWDGITPNSVLSNNYKTMECLWRDNVDSSLRKLTFIHPTDVERFYDDFYHFLSASGIDAVKTDVQSRIDELEDPRDKDLIFLPYQRALSKAAAKHLDSRVIYCMAHIPSILTHILLPRSGSKKIFRTSDDFYPHVPETHKNHIFTNAHNAHLFSRLHVVQDWDMFSSGLSPAGYAELHAVARALSGGARCITDTPGRHNKSVVRLMMEGIPEVTGVARAEDPWRGREEGGLVIWNVWKGKARGEVGKGDEGKVVGVFGCGRDAVGELIRVPKGAERAWRLGREEEEEVRFEEWEGERWIFVGVESGGWDVVFFA